MAHSGRTMQKDDRANELSPAGPVALVNPFRGFLQISAPAIDAASGGSVAGPYRARFAGTNEGFATPGRAVSGLELEVESVVAVDRAIGLERHAQVALQRLPVIDDAVPQ